MIRPGCFGVPSIFSFSSRVCNKCGSNADCQSKAHAALLAAPSGFASALIVKHNQYCVEYGIASPAGVSLQTTIPQPKKQSRVAARIPLSVEQINNLEKMPKRSADYLKKLITYGTDKIVMEAAAIGENAFTMDRHRPLHLALEKLLQGGITKASLRLALCEELGWSETSAFPQVTLVWNVFPAMGLAVENGCALVAGPNVRCKNNPRVERPTFLHE